MPDELPVAFSRRDAGRIAATVRRSEAAFRNQTPTGSRGDRQWRHHIRGLLLESLDRGTLTVPDSANMRVYILVDGVWTATSEIIRIYETGMLPSDTTLPVGCHVEASFVAATWCLSAFDCELEEIA